MNSFVPDRTNTTVNDCQSVGGLVRNNVDEQLWLGIQLALVCQALEPDLVQGLSKPTQNLFRSWIQASQYNIKGRKLIK
jgi:hypothetical protein